MSYKILVLEGITDRGLQVLKAAIGDAFEDEDVVAHAVLRR